MVCVCSLQVWSTLQIIPTPAQPLSSIPIRYFIPPEFYKLFFSSNKKQNLLRWVKYMLVSWLPRQPVRAYGYFNRPHDYIMQSYRVCVCLDVLEWVSVFSPLSTSLHSSHGAQHQVLHIQHLLYPLICLINDLI